MSAMMVITWASRRIILRSLASGDRSPLSGSNMDRAETAVRSTSMGWAPGGASPIKSITWEGSRISPTRRARKVFSSLRLGSLPYQDRKTTSSKVVFSARSWTSYPL